jgi:hypothetical protein
LLHSWAMAHFIRWCSLIYWLVVSTPLKNMNVNGKDYPIYEMENKGHVWNRQPVVLNGL